MLRKLLQNLQQKQKRQEAEEALVRLVQVMQADSQSTNLIVPLLSLPRNQRDDKIDRLRQQMMDHQATEALVQALRFLKDDQVCKKLKEHFSTSHQVINS